MLNGTEGAIFPFWSPDSRSVGFFADAKLKKIDVSGGPPLTLADAPLGRGGSWSPNGIIVFGISGGSPILRVSAAGGAPTPATAPAKGDTGWNSFPWFLPDGRHFLYGAQNPGGVTIRAGSLDGTAGEGKTLAEATTNAVYAQGFLLLTRESTLLAQPFDDRRLVTMGEAVPVAEQILRVVSGGVAGAFCASTGGLLLYQTGIGAGDQTLTWFDRSGNPLGTIGGAEYFLGTQFSPDRKSLMASITDRSARNMSLWVYDVARGLKTRFTLGP